MGITHTPGPWEVSQEDPHQIVSVEWGGIAWVPNEPAENQGIMEIMKANAALIAAAPEMGHELGKIVDALASGLVVTIEPGSVWANGIEKAVEKAGV